MAINIKGFVTALNTAFSNLQSRAIRDCVGYNPNSYKRANQAYAATTTFAEVTDLTIQLVPGRYRLTYILPTPSMTAAGNLQVRVNAGEGLAVAALGLSVNFFLTGVAPASGVITALNTAVGGGTTNAWTHVLVTGSIDVTSQGTLLLSATQVAASGSTTIAAGAVVEATQLTYLS